MPLKNKAKNICSKGFSNCLCSRLKNIIYASIHPLPNVKLLKSLHLLCLVWHYNVSDEKKEKIPFIYVVFC